MTRNKVSIIVYVIIGLAVIGIISQLLTNPVALLKNILFIIGFGLAAFAVIYFVFLRKRTGSNSTDMKKYKQAVKQSQRKYKQTHNTQATKPRQRQASQVRRKTSKHAPHLRVIEGNKPKPKRKDRATF